MSPNHGFKNTSVWLRKRLIGILVLLALLPGQALWASDWKAIESRFTGADNALVWHARFMDSASSRTAPAFDVTLTYFGARLKQDLVAMGEQKIASSHISLSENQKGELSLWRREEASVVAVENPPRRFIYTLKLRLASRLLIKQVHSVHQREPKFRIKNQSPELAGLDEDVRALAKAMQEGNVSRIEKSPPVRLALRLLTSSKPLGRTVDRVFLKSCKARINGRTLKSPVQIDPYGLAVIRVRARKMDKVTLTPVFQLKEYTAFPDTVKIKQKVLPAYAFVKLETRDKNQRVFGRKTGKPGEFKLGPLKVRTLQKLKLEAAYPLNPPGDRPRFRGEVLFRTGRPIEAYLDKGLMPPAPPLPRNLSMARLVGLVVKTSTGALNPDLGEIQGLSHRHLVDLYAIGYTQIRQNSELMNILENALIQEVIRKSWTYPQKRLTDGDGWMEQDAVKVLEYPSLAEFLSSKMEHSMEPRIWFAAEKSSFATTKIDKRSASPHALAAAALTRANYKKYERRILKQLRHLQTFHKASRPRDWQLSDLLKTGQALKFVSFYSQGKVRRLSGQLVRSLRQEAHRRFMKGHLRLALFQKVEIAHLMSPIWRPYLKTPRRLLVSSVPEKPLRKQDIFSETESLTGPERRYKAALHRMLFELKKQKTPDDEREKRLQNLKRSWQSYLIRIQNETDQATYKQKLNRIYQSVLTGK